MSFYSPTSATGSPFPTGAQFPGVGGSGGDFFRDFLGETLGELRGELFDEIFGEDDSRFQAPPVAGDGNQSGTSGSQNGSTGTNGATNEPAATVFSASDLNTSIFLVAIIAIVAYLASR